MDFKISLIEGQPVWDALPVGKIIYYPLEKRDYRPFAQARMCVNETDFFCVCGRLKPVHRPKVC